MSSISLSRTVLGQAVLGQRVAQHAARRGPRVIAGHAVPEERQVVGAGETGGAGPDDGDLLPGRLHASLAHAFDHGLEAVGQQHLVGDGAMDLAHVDGLVQGGAPAAVVAGVLADASRGGRQRVVQDDREEGVLQSVLLVELQEARDVHVQRAGVLARRERQVLAHAGPAALGQDVVLELVAVVPQAGEHRVGRALAQAAERHVTDHAAELVEGQEIAVGGRALREAVQDAQRLVEAHTAWHALAAGLGARELDEVARHVDHAVVFVHDDHAAGAHDRAQLRERLVVDRRVEHLGRDAAAGGAARLHGLDVAAVRAALADVVDEARQWRAQGHLHEARGLHLADQREDLGAGRLGAADLGEPGRAPRDDGGDVVPGLDVVDVGGLAVQALLGREGRARPGPPGTILERGDEGRLLAADEGTGTFHGLDVEVEATAQDIRCRGRRRHAPARWRAPGAGPRWGTRHARR